LRLQWASVDVRCLAKSRRWRSAIAIVAGLSLLAIIGSWALRSGFAAPTTATTAQPATLSHVTEAVGTNHFDRLPSQVVSSGSSHTHQVRYTNAWITRDRPPIWARSTPEAFRSQWPISLAALRCRPIAHSGAAVGAFVNEDILTQVCVARL
jgi:hypothetical protein